MIADTDELTKLQSRWAGSDHMLDRMKKLVTVTFATGGITSHGLSLVVYNLPLLLAFDVLKQTLAQARSEGLITCSGNHLGPLMDSGRDALPWEDWEGLRDGVRRRNEVAHDGKLFDSQQCIQDIERVKVQLVAWDIISAGPRDDPGSLEAVE